MPSAAGMHFAMNDAGLKDQPPVILLHGAGGSQAIWPAAVRRLTGQRVFALDLPGHGHSSGFGFQSIAAYSDQVIAFLAALGLYQAVFVGYEMGGAIALDLAVRHSAHVAGIGLIASGAYLGVPDEMLDAFSNPLTLSHAYHLYLQRAFGPHTPPQEIERVTALIKATRPSILSADWQACAAFDCRSHANQINSPAWIIVGAEDQLTPVAFSHFLAGQLPAARLQIVPNAGHMVILEQTGRVVQSLQQFLNALSAARMAGSRLVSQPSTVDVSADKKNP